MKQYHTLLLSFLFCWGATSAQSLDFRLYQSIHADRQTSLDHSFHALSQSAYPLSGAVVLTQGIYGLLRHDEQSLRYAAQSAAALVINTGVVYSLKYSIDRKRPFEAHPEYVPYELDTSPSFPSGHTSFAFTTATNLTLQYKKWYVAVPAYLWAGGIAYSRVHLGEHYPTDVLAGAAIGAGSAMAAHYINRWLGSRNSMLFKKKHPSAQTP